MTLFIETASLIVYRALRSLCVNLSKRVWISLEHSVCCIQCVLNTESFDKGIESLPQTKSFLSLQLCNPMSYALDISNYEFC